MDEISGHVRQSIEVFECLTEMLGPGCVRLTRFSREFELDRGQFGLKDDEIDSVGHPAPSPLCFQPARSYTCGGKLFDSGESDNVFSEQLLQPCVAVVVELCCDCNQMSSQASSRHLSFMTSGCAV